MFVKLAVFLITIYQKIISPLTIPSCRFIPTCSEYSLQAIKKYGFFKGSLMSLFRVLRCNPWCKGGYDPVE